MAMDSAGGVTVDSILEDFSELVDPRSTVNRTHILGDIIVIAILAVIAGADGPEAIGVWAASNESWLRSRAITCHSIPFRTGIIAGGLPR
jgi:DDE_Tnp_1-associated